MPPEEQPEIPEKERLPAEHFDDARYEQVKIEYDPLHNLLKNEAGLSEGEIAKFDIIYRTIESFTPSEPPKFEGDGKGTFISFSNYHDLLAFRKKLKPEERELFDSKSWGGGGLLE